MGMDYRDKKYATAKVGKALETLGWKLYGWKADKSDIMTAYFDPESWEGVATKEGFVACVNVSAYHVQKSGTDELRYVPQQGPECPRCEVKGVDPAGWTLDEARKEPAEFHLARLMAEYENQRFEVLPDRSGVKLFYDNVNVSTGIVRVGLLNAVSPLHFDDHGRMKCVRCHGIGTLPGKPKTEVVFTWPTFQANPGRSAWHVERNGQIISKGVGLNHCQTKEGALQMAHVIDGITKAGPLDFPSQQAEGGNGVTVSHNEALNGIELRFASKPSLNVLESLKRHGWRWSRANRCWYAKRSEMQQAFATSIVALWDAERNTTAVSLA